MSISDFSWQIPIWNRLTARLDSAPHAILLHGRRGIGKRALAERLAALMLCETKPRPAAACGTCVACGWFALGNHPDFRLVIPESDAEPNADDAEAAPRASGKAASKQIRIDQVRALQEWLAVPGHRGATRVAVLQPAEAMNASTQNALLKTLEEPTPGAVLMLVSHRIDRLLPTVRSRCQSVMVPSPTREASLQWLATTELGADTDRLLALAGGAPLDAAERPHLATLATQIAADLSATDADPVRLADGYQSATLTEVLDLVQKWTCDALAMRLGARPRYFVGFESALQQAAKMLEPTRATAWWRELAEARGLADHPLNARLVLESLFAGYLSTRTS